MSHLRAHLPRHRARTVLACGLLVALATACSAGEGQAPATTPSATPATSAAAPAPTSTTTGPEGDGEDGAAEVAPTTEVPESGSGRTTPVAVPGADTPKGETTGRVVRYTVEIEGGLEALAEGFPEAVRSTLTDERGWQTKDGVRFVNVSPEERKAGAPTDIRIRFASPTLVDRVCAPLRTNGRLSCHDGGDVMINAWRWVHGADTYGSDLANYRIYLVNHEVGHSIGHGHVPCPRAGAKAPIMLQQTLRLDGCAAYPYPVR